MKIFIVLVLFLSVKTFASECISDKLPKVTIKASQIDQRKIKANFCFDSKCQLKIVQNPQSRQYELVDTKLNFEIASFNLELNTLSFKSSKDRPVFYEPYTHVLMEIVPNTNPLFWTDLVWKELQAGKSRPDLRGKKVFIQEYNQQTEKAIFEQKNSFFGCSASNYQLNGGWMQIYDGLREFCYYETEDAKPDVFDSKDSSDQCVKPSVSFFKYVMFLWYKKPLVIIGFFILVLGFVVFYLRRRIFRSPRP